MQLVAIKPKRKQYSHNYKEDTCFTPEQQEELNSIIIYGGPWEFHKEDLVDEKYDWNSHLKGQIKNYSDEMITKFDKIPSWFDFELVKRINLSDDPSYDPVEDVGMREATVINKKVNVVVPGLGLLGITRCYVENDCCSDHLNEQLQKGWRILAICPQPDQRRPDYVLGRSDYEAEL